MGPAGTAVEATVLGLRPGFYVFRLQAKGKRGFSTLSANSSQKCLLPDLAEQAVHLRVLQQLIVEVGRMRLEELAKAADAARASAVHEDHPLLREAGELLSQKERQSHKQSFREVKIALRRLHARVQLEYAPGIVRAIEDALHIGVPQDSPPIRSAYQSLDKLLKAEEKQQSLANLRVNRMQEFQEAKTTLHEIIDLKIGGPCLDATLKDALKAGFVETDPLVQIARHAQRVEEVQQDFEYEDTDDPLQKNNFQELREHVLWASSCGKHRAVKALLSQRANPNEADDEGASPLLFAVNSQSIACVRVLLEGNALPNQADACGRTPLLACVAHDDCLRSVAMLVHVGADVHAHDSQGMTALHVAVMHRQVKIAKILLDCGAAPDAWTAKGKTPYTLASELPNCKARDKLMSLLEKALKSLDADETSIECSLDDSISFGDRKPVRMSERKNNRMLTLSRYSEML